MSYVSMQKWKNCVGPNIESKAKTNVDECDHMRCEEYGGGRLRVNTSHDHH